jgi:hypothetical protein
VTTCLMTCQTEPHHSPLIPQQDRARPSVESREHRNLRVTMGVLRAPRLLTLLREIISHPRLQTSSPVIRPPSPNPFYAVRERRQNSFA